VAEVLTGWYTKEAYGCCIAEIFHLVHTQSGEAAEIPVNRAMTEGRVVGLDNHVTLIARDGSVRKIADSCAPIRDAKGRVIGSVLVFRDVTAEYEARERITQANIRLKQSRDEIQQSESKFREIAETIHEVFFVCDADCRTLHYVSPAYEEVWGRSCASAYKDARSFADAIVPEDRARVFAAVEKMTESGYDEKYRITRPDGTMRWIHARGFCVRDGDGQVQRVVGLAADVTNEHKAMELILSKTALLEAQSETSPDGMLVVNADRRRILSNKRIFELFNVPQDIADCTDDAALHNHIVSQTKYPDAFLEKILHLYDHIEEKSSDEIELKNGMILDWYSSPVLGKDGKYYGRIWLFRDITQQKQAAEEMRKLSQVAEQIPNSVVISDLAGNMVYVNAAFTKLYEYTPDEVLGKNPRMLNSGLTSPETYTEMWGALTAGREWHGELQDQSKGGELVWQLVNICPLRDSAGKTTHYVTVMENITARKTMENELRTAALTDKLTGLPNRALICDRLQHAVLRFRRNNALHFAVLFLDIDRFKTINDSLGHDFGDLMFKEGAQRLRSALRCGDSVSRSASQDVAARLGGDEFVILLDSVASPDHAILVADRLIGNLSKPYRFGQTEVCTTVSIGVVTSINAEYTAEEVLRDADTAMYEAKLAGKGRCVLFDASMHQRVQNRLDIENDLRSAIEARQVFLMYQPIVSLKTGRIEGVEALVRWNHPRRGMLLPGEFVPIAEETGLIIPLGDWVLREACGQFACWRDQLGGSCPPSISVNLSRHQLLLSDLPQTLKQVLTTNGMTPDCLHLEITEGALMKDLAATIQMLTVIKKIGVKLEIDDFGTGYSSLACLRQFPIDVLKIDRSFVTNLNRGQDFVALVQTISQLARNLRIVVVAEGIETVQQMSTLQSLKCDLGQGYLFSKPMTPDEIATSFPLNFSVLTGQTMSEALAAV
jgi:diguanylate cyclase (GGDEF)-like protein/PAS domain S-box-containing protein